MNNPVRYIVHDIFSDMADWVKYNIFRSQLPSMPIIDQNLSLKIIKEKNGYWVTCPDYPGFIASGDTLEELRENLFDAILVYFNVSRYLSKRVPDHLKLNLPDGTEILPKAPLIGNIEVKLSYN